MGQHGSHLGHPGSPCIFLSRFLCSLQRKASRCAEAGHQVLATKCYKYHMCFMSTIAKVGLKSIVIPSSKLTQTPKITHPYKGNQSSNPNLPEIDDVNYWASNLVPVPDTFPKGSVHQLNWELGSPPSRRWDRYRLTKSSLLDPLWNIRLSSKYPWKS